MIVLPKVMHKPIVALIFMCVLIICQGMLVTGNLTIIISSIEKRFGYKSYQIGFIRSAYDLSYSFFGILVSYFGRNGRKLKYLAFGANLMSVGCIFFVLPQFIYPSYYPAISISEDNCQAFTSNESCGQLNYWPLVLFCIGYGLIGIGASPIYTLGCSYIDDITTHGQNGMYLGILYSCSAIGPAIGFILGKPFLTTWVDIKIPEDITIDSDSIDWIGAWWLGACVYAVLLLVCSIPLHLFPKKLNIKKEVSKPEKPQPTENQQPTNQNMLSQLKRLLKNHTYMILTFITMIDGISYSGLSAFISKHIESNFHQRADMSSLYTGLVVVPGAGSGLFFGGLCIKKFKWIGKQLMNRVAIVTLIVFGCTFILLVGCPQRPVVKSKSVFCLKTCDCSQARFEPLCSDSKTFYSPCLLGCNIIRNNSEKIFDCSCTHFIDNEIVDGYCLSNCDYLVPYMIVFLILMSLNHIPNVPMVDATLRSVNSDLSSLALGLQQSVVRIGYVIGPIVYGFLIDLTCIDWKKDNCNSTQNCQIYNSQSFRQFITMLTASIKFISFILCVISGLTWKSP